MSDQAGRPAPGYMRYIGAAFSHALTMMLRRKRAILAAAITLTPVLIPLAVAFLSSSRHAEDGNKAFVFMVHYLYLKAMAPLLALFFGSMLVGEDVESETIPYVFVRPIPRLAWVVGKFLAFLLITNAILIPSLALTYAACTPLGDFPISTETLKLLGHYMLIGFMALLGYGALCMLFGATVKRPVVIAAIFLFGWQRMATIVPGFIQFFTIEKYLVDMAPTLPTERGSAAVRAPLLEFQKTEFLIGATKAAVSLFLIAAVLLAITTIVVRLREYTRARSVTG